MQINNRKFVFCLCLSHSARRLKALQSSLWGRTAKEAPLFPPHWCSNEGLYLSCRFTWFCKVCVLKDYLVRSVETTLQKNSYLKENCKAHKPKSAAKQSAKTIKALSTLQSCVPHATLVSLASISSRKQCIWNTSAFLKQNKRPQQAIETYFLSISVHLLNSTSPECQILIVYLAWQACEMYDYLEKIVLKKWHLNCLNTNCMPTRMSFCHSSASLHTSLMCG